MFNACIIDDEKNSRDVLEMLIKQYHSNINIIGMAHNVASGSSIVNNLKPDFIFLDIEMPDGTGFDLIKNLKNPLPQIIFCTAYDQYAINAIECSALAYLLKPVSSYDLNQAIIKAIDKNKGQHLAVQINLLNEQLVNKNNPTRFIINTNEEVKIIKFEEVICCVAESNYTKILLNDGTKVTATKTLKEFETILIAPYFFRIHHSSLININYVKRIQKGDGYIVELPFNPFLDLAKIRKEQLLEKIASI
jgi:two-component system, LytTR family, response regulator